LTEALEKSASRRKTRAPKTAAEKEAA